MKDYNYLKDKKGSIKTCLSCGIELFTGDEFYTNDDICINCYNDERTDEDDINEELL